MNISSSSNVEVFSCSLDYRVCVDHVLLNRPLPVIHRYAHGGLGLFLRVRLFFELTDSVEMSGNILSTCIIAPIEQQEKKNRD